jgi:hypothetical protein
LPKFKKESDIEMAARKTSFDFYIQTVSALQIFVEVKYTEVGLGKAKNDKEHQDKFRDTYVPQLNKSTFLKRHGRRFGHVD